MKNFISFRSSNLQKFKFPKHLLYKFGWHSNIVMGAWAGCEDNSLIRNKENYDISQV